MRISAFRMGQAASASDVDWAFPCSSPCAALSRSVRATPIGPRLRTALRAATGCVAVSETLRDLALRSGVDPQAVQVIHNAIDAATFSPGDSLGARRRLGLPADAKLIVSVGHLIDRKRHHVLVEAFAAVRREFPDATLAVIGGRSAEPRYASQLEARVRSLGLQSSRFAWSATWRSRMSSTGSGLPIAFALLSAREGCCNAVLEALAVGVPVVATPAGDNAVFVRSGINGEIVPVDDAPATARALSAVLQRASWDRIAIASKLAAQVGSWGAGRGAGAGVFQAAPGDPGSCCGARGDASRSPGAGWMSNMPEPTSPPLPLRMPLSLLSPNGRRGRLLIFTYHRVLAQPDPLLPDEADAASFAAHMDWVREFCNVLPLPEAARRLRDGTLPARATCITFDDGYANNYEVARPILLQRRLTATVFIAVDAVERGIMWNDLVIESVRQAGGRLDPGIVDPWCQRTGLARGIGGGLRQSRAGCTEVSAVARALGSCGGAVQKGRRARASAADDDS